MESSWFSIIPFLIVIPIAIFTKQVLPGLFLGLLVGAYLIDHSIVGGVEKLLHYVVQALRNKSNIEIVVFLYAFSGLIGMIKMAGGVKGFVETAAERIDTRKSSYFNLCFNHWNIQCSHLSFCDDRAHYESAAEK